MSHPHDRQSAVDATIAAAWVVVLTPWFVLAATADPESGERIRWQYLVPAMVVAVAAGFVYGRHGDRRRVALAAVAFALTAAAISAGGALTYPGQEEPWGAIIVVNLAVVAIPTAGLVGLGAACAALGERIFHRPPPPARP